MTKQNFYDFGVMMKNDSELLFNNNSFHNSVYLGAFVLEAYIKVLLINNGANTHIGTRDNSYGGHICSLNFVNRLNSISPEAFSNSILESNNNGYPTKLLSSDYSIHYRYEVNKWTDEVFCQDIQDEVLKIYQALNNFRITGVL